MNWSKMGWGDCLLSEPPEDDIALEYRAFSSLTTSHGSTTLARVERYRGYKRDDKGVWIGWGDVVFKVGIVRLDRENEFDVYDLFDSSIEEARDFAEAMVKAI